MNKKRILALALVMVMVVGLCVACGKAAVDVVGVWNVTKIQAEDTTMDLEEFADAYGVDLDITVEFTKEGKVIMSVFGEEETTEYTVKGNKVIIDGEEAIVNGDEIKMEEKSEGMMMILKKQA